MSRHAIAAELRTLANKAITRVSQGVGMTELMPEDVRLLQRAAEALSPNETYLDRLARTDPAAHSVLGPVLSNLIPMDPRA